MKMIDFHPDDLLDRELSGALSPGEERRLRQHLVECASCRLERQSRVDFEQELAPGAARGLQSSVSGAMRAALAPVDLATVEQPAPRASVGPRPRAPRRGLTAVLSVGLVAVSGLAAAQAGWAARVMELVRERVASITGDAPSRPASAPSSKLGQHPAGDTERGPQQANDAVIAAMPHSAREAASPALAQPAANTPRAAEEARHALGARSERESVRHGGPVESTTSSRAEAPSTPATTLRAEAPSSTEASSSASALFERASASRRLGHGSDALRLYDQLRARFPASAEARLSLAVVARLQLDLGQADAAIEGFAAYLATGDRVLREQALAGHALALGRRGLVSAELESWRALLRDYPSSSYARLAAQRLRQDAK